MRILRGKFKGRKLLTPAEDITRPTLGRIKEAIFNILEHRFKINFHEITVLDLYAGTGALGCESLSRGAQQGVFVELNKAAMDILKKNSRDFSSVTFLQDDVRNLKDNPFSMFDLVFLDPPYFNNLVAPTLTILQDYQWVHKDSLIVAEMGIEEPFHLPLSYEIVYTQEYASTKICFIQLKK